MSIGKGEVKSPFFSVIDVIDYIYFMMVITSSNKSGGHFPSRSL